MLEDGSMIHLNVGLTSSNFVAAQMRIGWLHGSKFVGVACKIQSRHPRGTVVDNTFVRFKRVVQTH